MLLRGEPHLVAEECVILGVQSEVLHRVATGTDIDCYVMEKEPLEELGGQSVLCPFLLSPSHALLPSSLFI